MMSQENEVTRVHLYIVPMCAIASQLKDRPLVSGFQNSKCVIYDSTFLFCQFGFA
ncbi:hypothetical protein GGGNBK_23320 (plasmid) [Sporosarcina sp. ANT_H38]